MAIADDLGALGVEVLRELVMRLLDKFLPEHGTDGSPDQEELNYILQKIKETQDVKLQGTTP